MSEAASHAEASFRRLEGQLAVRRFVGREYFGPLEPTEPWIPVDHPERERPQPEGSPLDPGSEED